MIFKRIKDFIVRKQKKKEYWKLTDFIISTDDIMHDFSPSFDHDKDIVYTCIRDFRDICIYVEEDKFEKFSKIDYVYDSTEKVINLSNLMKNQIKCLIACEVYNKVSPMSVEIKSFITCRMSGIDIIITFFRTLSQQDPLFRELVTFQSLKDKYNFG